MYKKDCPTFTLLFAIEKGYRRRHLIEKSQCQHFYTAFSTPQKTTVRKL